MSNYYSAADAAEGLTDGLQEMKRLAKERERYEWDAPYAWTEDKDRAVRRVRDAVRFLCSPEADDH